ncbi:MAG: hypothetical protein IJX85_09885 [Lachnospiraceae bacterium]|nr:hypothetical protein [Lachnospiraceae bacterium]
MLSEGLKLETILKKISPANYPARENIEEKPYNSIMSVLDYTKVTTPEYKEIITEIELYIDTMGKKQTIQQLKQYNFDFEKLYSMLNKLIEKGDL